MRLADFELRNNVFVAPMAGVTDRPFRQLCKRLGAGYAISEMAASNPKLWDSEKTSRRTNHDGEMEPKAVQLAGADPVMLAQAAAFNIDCGAQVIDLNMGCPAKKVCNVAAGSALLKDENLVARILEAVVTAASVGRGVPVTLKFRTGWDRTHRNAVRIAQLAENAGIQMLTLHGRTRDDHYGGAAEYDTIAEVKTRVRIPIIANGDIDSPVKARWVLGYTGADGVMIGRAAQGRPWIFREITHYLATGTLLPPPTVAEAREVIVAHLADHHAFYGEAMGVRIARKHLGWYTRALAGGDAFRATMNAAETTHAQLALVERYFDELAARGERLQIGAPASAAAMRHAAHPRGTADWAGEALAA